MEKGEPLTVASMAEHFINGPDKYDESHLPTHVRWTNVLLLCPFARRRRIYDDFDQDLQQVYETGTYDEVFGASELILLRWRFYSILFHYRIGMRHIANYETQTAWTWMRKLADKLDQMAENRRRAPKEKHVQLKHAWLN